METNNIAMGILAHVDAGKTTLCESLLYCSNTIKKLGRVDHRDSFLDTHSLERQRGITIFSKQARFELNGKTVTLLDTPGHVDFSAEAERTMQILDYAVLVISGTDGVQAHTETLWRLIQRYRLPCFIFVTKMDLPGADREALMDNLKGRLSDSCVDFCASPDEIYDELALCSESAMEEYLQSEKLRDDTVSSLIKDRRVYPCFFGSGLRLEGVDAFLSALGRYMTAQEHPEQFGAKVYKIARDEQGNRLTYLKCTGGELKVRSQIAYFTEKGEAMDEKITQIRLYSGMKYDTAESVKAGDCCAVTGLTATYPGQGLGAEPDSEGAALEPVLRYRIILPEGVDAALILPKLMQLGQEDPQLHMQWNERLGEITVSLMGKVQTEVLRAVVRERFDVDIELDTGHIVYRETIRNKVEGVGHFEPLRHYAEVHLLMEPLPLGSGIVIDSVCPEDALDRNWQRLILSHLYEKTHLGVLTGSPVTDIHITLASGKAHVKHTEGGDFREATYRAVRNGLMQAESELLEPWYHFSVEVPAEQIGRVISDVRAMDGQFDSPEAAGEFMRIEGIAPVSEMNDYARELTAYTRGRGRISLSGAGYRPCHNAEKVIEELGYEPERDVENTADSVFCSHGAGTNVHWSKVREYMHLESCLREEKPLQSVSAARRNISIDERELEAIMEREFGPIRRPEYSAGVRNEAKTAPVRFTEKREYVIVDGYNLIFAWDEMKALAGDSLDTARARLMDILSNYCGYTGNELVLVFDGFRTAGNPGSKSEYHNFHVTYTRDGETGDQYIEKLANDVGRNYNVRVVTSDNLIRLSALRSGVLRCSSKDFIAELRWTMEQIDEILKKTNVSSHTSKLRDAINTGERNG